MRPDHGVLSMSFDLATRSARVIASILSPSVESRCADCALWPKTSRQSRANPRRAGKYIFGDR